MQNKMNYRGNIFCTGDLINNTFTVLSKSIQKGDGGYYIEARCKCGNMFNLKLANVWHDPNTKSANKKPQMSCSKRCPLFISAMQENLASLRPYMRTTNPNPKKREQRAVNSIEASVAVPSKVVPGKEDNQPTTKDNSSIVIDGDGFSVTVKPEKLLEIIKNNKDVQVTLANEFIERLKK